MQVCLGAQLWGDNPNVARADSIQRIPYNTSINWIVCLLSPLAIWLASWCGFQDRHILKYTHPDQHMEDILYVDMP